MTKFVLAALLTTFSISAHADTVASADAQASVARVVEVVQLVKKPGLQVSVAVQDHGGSTDVSPTQTVYLTLYSKGEMFSSDATFKIADVFSFTSAKRISGGVYEISAVDAERLEDVVYRVDARAAVTKIQKVTCDDFDCAASSGFKASVDVEKTILNPKN